MHMSAPQSRLHVVCGDRVVRWYSARLVAANLLDPGSLFSEGGEVTHSLLSH